jgi:hypothetical protein
MVPLALGVGLLVGRWWAVAIAAVIWMVIVASSPAMDWDWDWDCGAPEPSPGANGVVGVLTHKVIRLVAGPNL